MSVNMKVFMFTSIYVLCLWTVALFVMCIVFIYEYISVAENGFVPVHLQKSKSS